MSTTIESDFGFSEGVAAVWDTLEKGLDCLNNTTAAHTLTIFRDSLKDASIVKRYAGLTNNVIKVLDLFGQPVGVSWSRLNDHLKQTKLILSCCEVVTKSKNIFKPLADYSVCQFQVGDKPAEASLWEKIAKKAFQVADYVLSGCDGIDFANKLGLLNAPAVQPLIKSSLSVIRTGSGLIMSSYGLYEEISKLYTNHQLKGDKVVELTNHDRSIAYLKIAMSVAYLSVALFGIATTAGMSVPYMETMELVCLTAASSFNIATYFTERVG
jgi:hypothetical protein